ITFHAESVYYIRVWSIKFVHPYSLHLQPLHNETKQALFEPPYIQISLIILLKSANRDRITDSLIIHQWDPPTSILIPIIKVQSLFRTHPQSIFTIKIGAKDQAAVQGCGIVQYMFIGFIFHTVITV